MNLVDEPLNYHYPIAEPFRSADVTPEGFWGLPKARRSDLVRETLFVRRTPLSEATRGVAAVLAALGLDPRAFFAAQRAGDYVDRVPDRLTCKLLADEAGWKFYEAGPGVL